MTDITIMIIVAVVLVLALHSFVGHFRGRSGCCGGSGYKARHKKLKSVAERKTAIVEGMSCQNCVNRVMEAINDIPGASARVKLRGGRVLISTERPIDNSVFLDAIEKAGYTVTRIS